MSEVLKKTYLTGLGVVSLTYEKAEKLARDLIKKGELAKEKQEEFISTLVEKAKQNTSQIEKIVKEKIDELTEKGKPLNDKQDELIKELSKKAKKLSSNTEKKVKKIVKDIMEKSKTAKDKIKSSMTSEEKVEETLKKLKIPTKNDIEVIIKKLDELIKLQKQEK